MIDGTIPIPACTLAARIRDPDEGHEINELPNTSSLHEAVPAAAALDAGSLAAAGTKKLWISSIAFASYLCPVYPSRPRPMDKKSLRFLNTSRASYGI